jgi:hypothetical protein
MKPQQRMRPRLLAIFVACMTVLVIGIVLAQDKPAGCVQAGAPEKVEGEIVRIDPDQGTMKLRDANGATHDFRASADTLRSYKVGDRLEAKLRPGQECKQSAS